MHYLLRITTSPVFVGFQSPLSPLSPCPSPSQEMEGMFKKEEGSAVAWNVFVKVFVDHDNANNRKREKEWTLSGCLQGSFMFLCEKG